MWRESQNGYLIGSKCLDPFLDLSIDQRRAKAEELAEALLLARKYLDDNL